MKRLCGIFLLITGLTPAVWAQNTAVIPDYAAKIAYREYLRQNNLNPSDEEIVQQIDALKAEPQEALGKLLENTPEPETAPNDDLGVEIARLQREKPKRLGNHPLFIDPNLF